MKIKRNTPDLFIAEEVPWFIAIMLFFFTMIFVSIGLFLVFDGVWAGLIFAIAGGGLGFGGICVFVERLQVILDAHPGQITLRRRTVLSHQETTLPLQDLHKAEVEESISRESRRSRPGTG